MRTCSLLLLTLILGACEPGTVGTTDAGMEKKVVHLPKECVKIETVDYFYDGVETMTKAVCQDAQGRPLIYVWSNSYPNGRVVVFK